MIVVKIIGSIFNVNLVNFSHLYLVNCFLRRIIKFNARNIGFNQRPIVINKITTNSGTNSANYYQRHDIRRARRTFITIFIFSESYFSQLHFFNSFSTLNGATNFFLILQFSWSKYSPTLHTLSHSHSQLLGFQINPLSYTLLSINYLHSHLHLSLF